MNDFQDEYLRQKENRAEQAELTQEQKVKQELRKLPQGEELFNWIAHHVGKRSQFPVVWQYADENVAQQNRSNRIHLMNGRTHQVIQTIEVNRKEIAQTRATGQSWIEQLMFAINGEQQYQSSMHSKMEQDMSDRYEEMMEKLTGGNQ